MPADGRINLSPAEVAKMFSDPATAAKFPPILTIEQASELVQVPVETIRGWRSRKLLDSCSVRKGKRVRFLRDRWLLWYCSNNSDR